MEPTRPPQPWYPVTLETRAPWRFERTQVLLRLAVLVAIGVLHQTLGGLFGALYVLFPIGAAILISRKGTPGFGEEDERRLMAVLDWVIAFYAYLFFVTDRFPLESRDRAVWVVVRPRGTPTAGVALARLVTSLPHAVVLAVLGIASGTLAFVAAVLVVVTERVPDGLYAFQRDVLVWMARLFAYHASLVEPYPPFSLASGEAQPPTSDQHHAPPV